MIHDLTKPMLIVAGITKSAGTWTMVSSSWGSVKFCTTSLVTCFLFVALDIPICSLPPLDCWKSSHVAQPGLLFLAAATDTQGFSWALKTCLWTQKYMPRSRAKKSFSTGSYRLSSESGRKSGIGASLFSYSYYNDQERLTIKWTLKDRIDPILPPPVWKTCFSISEWTWHAKNHLVI